MLSSLSSLLLLLLVIMIVITNVHTFSTIINNAKANSLPAQQVLSSPLHHITLLNHYLYYD